MTPISPPVVPAVVPEPSVISLPVPTTADQIIADFVNGLLRQCLLDMATEMVAEAEALERKRSATPVSLSETADPRGLG